MLHLLEQLAAIHSSKWCACDSQKKIENSQEDISGLGLTQTEKKVEQNSPILSATARFKEAVIKGR